MHGVSVHQGFRGWRPAPCPCRHSGFTSGGCTSESAPPGPSRPRLCARPSSALAAKPLVCPPHPPEDQEEQTQPHTRLSNTSPVCRPDGLPHFACFPAYLPFCVIFHLKLVGERGRAGKEPPSSPTSFSGRSEAPPVWAQSSGHMTCPLPRTVGKNE